MKSIYLKINITSFENWYLRGVYKMNEVLGYFEDDDSDDDSFEDE